MINKMITIGNVEYCSFCLRALFTTTLHSREKSDVTIQGVSSEMLQLLIEYAYVRKVTITQANVHGLLAAADYLCFLDVLQLCCDYLKAALRPDNCLTTMLFARLSLR